MKKLTNRQRLFVQHYLTCWNAAEAARRAGYSPRGAEVAGSRLLSDVNVAAQIEQRVADLTMGAEEALTRLGEQARAAYADYIREDGTVDLAGMKRDGKMHLVKGVKYTRAKQPVVEFYDGQAALFKVLQVHGLPVERAEVTLEIDDARDAVRRGIDRLVARLRTGGGAGAVGGDAEGGGDSAL